MQDYTSILINVGERLFFFVLVFVVVLIIGGNLLPIKEGKTLKVDDVLKLAIFVAIITHIYSLFF